MKATLYGYISIVCTGLGLAFTFWGAYFKDMPALIVGLFGVIIALLVGYRAEVANDKRIREEADFVEWCEAHENAELTLADAWEIERMIVRRH